MNNQSRLLSSLLILLMLLVASPMTLAEQWVDNRVVGADYRVNGGAPSPAPAADGAFGGIVEQVDLTLGRPGGAYYIH